MTFVETLIIPVQRYGQYDGTNSADIVDHFTRAYDPGTQFRFDTAVHSEAGGVLTLNWEGGYRNSGNTSWEIYNFGTTDLAEGDYFLLVPSGSGLQSIQTVQASLIGQEYAIVEATP